MSEAKSLYSVLRQSADPDRVAAIEELVRDAPDRTLCRVNVLDFAAKTGLDEERAIAAFLHAARLGLFELSWNVLCPSCGGVLEAGTTLKSVDREEYHCAWCAAGYQPILDEIVEVTFTVSRRVRRIAAHDPNELPFAENCGWGHHAQQRRSLTVQVGTPDRIQSTSCCVSQLRSMTADTSVSISVGAMSRLDRPGTLPEAILSRCMSAT